MSVTKIKVGVTLKPNKEIASIIGRAEMAAAYSKNSDVLLKKLESKGITEERLARYYYQLQILVCAYAHDRRMIGSRNLKDLGFRFNDMKNLYLPVISATILSQIGDCTIGNYDIEVEAIKGIEAKGKNDATDEGASSEGDEDWKVIDKAWIIEMSNALRDCRDLFPAYDGQLGNTHTKYSPDFMCNILTALEATTYQCEVRSKDGYNPDQKLKALAAFAGITLVNQAFQILYTEVDFIRLDRPDAMLAILPKVDHLQQD